MPDFIHRRKLARLLDRASERLSDLQSPDKGWITSMRTALGMSAEQVATRKGVSRNAIYQAERSELEGAVSLKQMENLATAMGGKFVYAIIPNAPIEQMKLQQARNRANASALLEPGFSGWSKDDQQDWIDDAAAELLHNMPTDFWDHTGS